MPDSAPALSFTQGRPFASTDFDALISHLPDIVFRLDRELRHLFIGGAVHRISTLHPGRFIGRTGRELDFPPGLCDRVEAACREVLARGEVRTLEAEIEGVWILHRLVPERNDRGEIVSILGIAEDVTDRKRADDLLLESQRRLQEFVRNQPAAVAMFDRGMRYLETSERWLVEHGLRVDAPVVGRSHYELVPDLPPHWKDAHRRGMEGEVIRSPSELWTRAEGGSIWVRWEVRPWRTFGGEIGGILAFGEDITAHKRTEEALRETARRLDVERARTEAVLRDNQEKFGLLSANMAELFQVLEPIFDDQGRAVDFRYLEVNAATEALAGRSRGDMEGRTARELWGDIESYWVRMIGEVARTGVSAHMEDYSAGLDAYYEVHVWKLDDSRVALVGSNVSDRVRAQMALRAVSAELQHTLDTAATGLTHLDRDMRYRSVNPAYLRWLGRPKEAVIGRTIREVLGEAAFARIRPRIDRVLRGERVEYEDELPIDGVLRPVHVVYSPDRHADGEVPGWVESVTDATERRRNESLEHRVDAQAAELRDHAARLAAVLDTAVDSIITIDGRGIIQSVNPAAVRAFGYTAAEMIGRNVSMLMPAPYKDQHDDYLARYRSSGERRIIGKGREVQARRKDGSVFAIDLAVSEVIPGSLFTGMIRDISDRKEAEGRLAQSQRLAAIGTLAAGLGHDMNNTLLPVRAGLNALLAERLSLSPLACRSVEGLVGSVAYLQQLADGLHFLTLDPSTSEDVRGGGGAADLRRWWSQAGALLTRAAPRHVSVVASIPEGLPEVRLAPHALTQVVLNLIANAGDSIPADRRRGRIRVWAAAESAALSGYVQLGVADNGVGMTDDVKRHAFDMFFTTKPRGLGTGLGLALVRRILDGVGATIEIESTLGKGTAVVLRLPSANESAAGRRLETRAAISIRNRRAEALVRQLLEDGGLHATCTESPRDADVWFTEPEPSRLAEAADWRRRHGDQGRLVLVGRSGRRSTRLPRAWESLRPVAAIDDPDDFDAVLAAVARVTQA